METFKCYHMTLLRKGKDGQWVCNTCGGLFDLDMIQSGELGL